MNIEVIVIHFTHVYRGQPFARDRRFAQVDCSDLGGVDCYCDPGAEQVLRERIEPWPVCGMHLLDSGNFHYMTKLWTDRIDTPFDLVLFDRHPDMQPPAFGEMLSCGGWVKAMLDANPHVRRVCIVGASPELVQEVEAGYGGRVVFCDGQPGGVDWQAFLGDADVPVYVSVDKDVLDPADALTNWDQGSMRLGTLLEMLSLLLKSRRVLGADICGEYSPDEAFRDERCAALNSRANEQLLRLFFSEWRDGRA